MRRLLIYVEWYVVCLTVIDRLIRKFIQMSYLLHGCGPSSRNAQFIVHQCVHMLYALRCIYFIHCMEHVDQTLVEAPASMSNLYLNSQRNSGFTAIQNIKRPGKSCIPENHRQNVTWICCSHTSLEVHTGKDGLGRVQVSHTILRQVFRKILDSMTSKLQEMRVPILCDSEFDALRESTNSVQKGEGMGTYNQKPWTAAFIRINEEQNFRIQFIQQASNLYRLMMTAVHVSGGPSPRGTEQAVTRLLNSDTELMRNVILVDGTIGMHSG
jgi:hypothetical protein